MSLFRLRPPAAAARCLSRVRRWWQLRRRDPIADRVWQELLYRLHFLRDYEVGELARLRELAERFLRIKHIHGAGGLTVTPEMRAAIAVQACVPILNLGLEWYRGWYSVVVYPDDFVAPYEYTDEHGVVHEGERELAGEAWPQGPVVLSWTASTGALRDDGGWGNLVIHEFAHKLDLLNGDANGQPPLHPGMSQHAWTEAFSAAYEDFCRRVDSGEAVPFDEYGAEDPGEFFAVTSEWFFTQPRVLHLHYPRMYAQLQAFYHPARAAS